MISRYALYDIAKISSFFQLSKGLPKGVKPHYNISPTISAPVIVNNNGSRTVQLMKWGLVPKNAKDTTAVFRYKTYNIPSEKIFLRHSWEKAIRESRCLIPINGFYKLNESGKKHAYYITSKDDSLLALAGVYSTWQDPAGTVHGTYSVITTEATDDASGLNSRIPIIIKPEDEDTWLNPLITDANTLYDILRPYPSNLLDIYEVSPDVYSPKPNHAHLINRI